MNLYVDGHLFDGAGQGTKTYLKGLYAPLIEAKTHDHFFLASSNPDNISKEFGHARNVTYLRNFSHNKFVRLGLDIPRQIRRNRIDIAHFQYISPLIKTTREAVTVHDLLFLDYPQYFPISYRLTKGPLFRRSAKRADVVATVSDYSKEQLIRHFSIPEKKIITTPNGVLKLYDDESESQVDLHKTYGLSNFILYVSRFEPRKNQLGLLKCYIDLQLWRQEIQLVLIGEEGIHSPAFSSLYNSLEPAVKKFVFILRNVDFESLRACYRKCLLFVYPSLAEGFGIPPLEAAVCGAQVVCSNTTSMADFRFFADGLVDPSDGHAFAEKIKYYLDHPRSQEQRVEIKTMVLELYNWSRSAEIFWDGITRLL